MRAWICKAFVCAISLHTQHGEIHHCESFGTAVCLPLDECLTIPIIQVYIAFETVGMLFDGKGLGFLLAKN